MKSRRTTNASHRKNVQLVAVAVVVLFILTWFRFSRTALLRDDYSKAMNFYGTAGSNDFSLAFQQSKGFFDDISDSEWQRMQAHVQQMQPNTCQEGELCATKIKNNLAWYVQANFEPEFSCRHERRIGTRGDGGKWVCDPHRLQKKKDCLVYSVGSYNKYDFEEGVFAQLGTHCEVHTFDPTDYSSRAKSIRNLQEPSTIAMLKANNISFGPGTDVQELNLNFHKWGISKQNSTPSKPGEKLFLTVEDTVKKLGHVGRTIHLFKIDCEGCELTSFETWVDFDPSFLQMQQVLVEVHARNSDINNVTNFFRGMLRHGYVNFHKEVNIIALAAARSMIATEFGFLKLQPEFFQPVEQTSTYKK